MFPYKSQGHFGPHSKPAAILRFTVISVKLKQDSPAAAIGGAVLLRLRIADRIATGYTSARWNASSRAYQVNAIPLPPQTKHPGFVRYGVLLVCGFAIGYGSDLFKPVTKHESTHIWFDAREGPFHGWDAWNLLSTTTKLP